MKFKDRYPKFAFKDEHDDDLGIIDMGLTSLEGCPKIIHGDFYCYNNDLTSLVDGPERVEGSYWCYNNQLASLDGIASYIGKDFDFYDNPIESIAGIHKKIIYFGGRYIWIPSSCKKGLLDVFKMNTPDLQYFRCDNEKVNNIFDKYLQLVHSGQLTKSQAMLQCQSELIENDLDEYTEY